ncbi:MAG: DUF2726 domain-containing protein [Phycisphaeraceae bacterium JB051]
MQNVLIILAAVSGSIVIGALAWPLIMHYRVSNFKLERLKTKQAQPKYGKVDRFIDTAEMQTLESLKQCIGKEMSVYPKVRLASLLKLTEGKESENPQLAAYVRQHAVDFALCDASTQKPILVVLLRNMLDQSEKTKLERAQLEEVLSDAGLAVLPISRQEVPNSVQIAQSLQSTLAVFVKQQANAA